MLPTADDVREFLQGYGIDTVETIERTGNTSSGDEEITDVNTEGLLTGMRVSGSGIQEGSEIVSIDHRAGVVTLDLASTATETDVTVSFTYYKYMSNSWIEKRRDGFIVPWVEDKCRQSFTGEKTVTEYHSGSGSSVLHLNTKPVNSIENIELIEAGSSVEYSISVGTVELIGSEGILKARIGGDYSVYEVPAFPRGKKNIKITYKAGFDDMPEDVSEAVLFLMAEFTLSQIEGRTGGGDLSVQSHSRSYGDRGKYTHIRNDLARKAMGLLRKYFTGSVGG